MLTFLKSLSPVLASLPICNHFHVRRVNSGRITPFKGVALFRPSFVRTPFTQWHEILLQNTRDSKLSYGENQVSISAGLETVPGRDGQTDRQNYRS